MPAGYDIVIVGAGAAGCVLAHRLSADGHIRVNIHTSMHAVGTCAMGLQQDAVVDAELEVRGLRGCVWWTPQ